MRLFWYDFCNSVIEAIFRTFFNYNLIIAFNVTSLMFARNILQRSIKKPFSSAKKLLGHPRKKSDHLFFFSSRMPHSSVYLFSRQGGQNRKNLRGKIKTLEQFYYSSLLRLYKDDEFQLEIKLTVTDESPYRTEETSGVSCLSLIKIEVFFGIPSDALS